MGDRFEKAPDIWADCFDFDQLPLPRGTYTQSPTEIAAHERPKYADLDWGHDVHLLLGKPAGDLEALMERIFVLPGLKKLDHRSTIFDKLSSIERTVVDLKRANNSSSTT